MNLGRIFDQVWYLSGMVIIVSPLSVSQSIVQLQMDQ